MKQIIQFTAFAAALLLCIAVPAAEVPELPAPRGGQFAVELYKIVTPRPFDQKSFRKEPESIAQLFQAAENSVTSQPVLYTELGGTAENDQTREMLLPEDYNVVGGKAVPVNKLYHIGVRTRVKILNATRTTAAVHIDFHHQVLKGYEKCKLGQDLEAELPIFDIRKVNTEITHKLDSWVVLGGIESEEDGAVRTSYYIIRISRP